jgi:ribonuclease HI
LVKLGDCIIIVAEFLAIFHGIKMALNKGFNRVITESDSKEAV